MSILNRAGLPAATIEPSASVLRGVDLMHEKDVGALFVIEHDEVVGALTRSDVALRVVLRRRDPATTAVRDVMTSPAVTLAADATIPHAIRVMATHGVHHLPVVSQGSVKGMVTLRHLLRERAADLTDEMDSLVARVCADGIGG